MPFVKTNFLSECKKNEKKALQSDPSTKSNLLTEMAYLSFFHLFLWERTEKAKIF